MPSNRELYSDQPRPSYENIDIPDHEDEVKELLKRSVEAANNSIVITDPHQPGNPIIFVNQGFKELTGYSEAEILGSNCRFLQRRGDDTWDSEQPAVQTLRQAVKSGSRCRVVLRNYRKGGEMFWNELYLTPVFNNDGGLVNFVGVQNDITERVRLNETLERRVQERTRELEQKTKELERQRDALEHAKEKAEAASRAKSVFLANMSHEIRTPLTAILGLADVMRAKSKDGRFYEHIRRIKSAGSRLMDTLSSLLTLAKLEAGDMQVDLHPVVMADEALEVLELFRENAREKGLELDFSVSDAARDAVARVDAGALNSALQNLIANAIKFTKNGRVAVHVAIEDADSAGDAAPEAGPYIGVHVKDTGIGISDDFRPYLFEDFRQESDGLTREHEGSGLGLSIAKQLVEAMNGDIKVVSEPGEGSTFTVLFPLQQSSVPPQQEEEPPAMPEPMDARVLLLEDNENTIFLVRDLLDETVSLTVARSAKEAMRYAARLNFDLLLVDINLGAGGSGVDFLHTIRERPSYADTPIVAVTAIAMPGDRERILAAGFDEYLAKPFESSDFLDLIDRYLKRDDAPQQRGTTPNGHDERHHASMGRKTVDIDSASPSGNAAENAANNA